MSEEEPKQSNLLKKAMPVVLIGGAAGAAILAMAASSKKTEEATINTGNQIVAQGATSAQMQQLLALLNDQFDVTKPPLSLPAGTSFVLALASYLLAIDASLQQQITSQEGRLDKIADYIKVNNEPNWVLSMQLEGTNRFDSGGGLVGDIGPFTWDVPRSKATGYTGAIGLQGPLLCFHFRDSGGNEVNPGAGWRTTKSCDMYVTNYVTSAGAVPTRTWQWESGIVGSTSTYMFSSPDTYSVYYETSTSSSWIRWSQNSLTNKPVVTFKGSRANSWNGGPANGYLDWAIFQWVNEQSPL